MASVIFECPYCQGEITAEQTGLKGRIISCPHCGKQVKVPSVSEVEQAVSTPSPQSFTPSQPSSLDHDEVIAETLTQGKYLSPGTIVKGIYRVERHLGESSLGEVYVCEIIAEKKKVQLEVIDGSDAETIERLSREIEFLAALQHPNIVRAFDAGQDKDIFFLASEYEEGITLRELLDKKGKLPEKEALQYAVHIAEALNYAWEQRKILHRDIKPSNIFITNQGKAKLMGFGVAKSSEGQSLGLTGIGFTIGTPQYMSPEQIRAEEDLDCRSDMYILGCVLYEMLAGQVPFDDKVPMLVMQKQMDEEPPPITNFTPEVSEATIKVLSCLLAKDRNDRPSSWKETIQLLRSAMEQVGKPQAKPGPSKPTVGDKKTVPTPNEQTKKPKETIQDRLGCTSLIVFILSVIVYLAVR